MRVAALYDVHGNLPALEAVLAEVERERVDAIVCGGDVVAGPFPAEVLDLLLTLPNVRFVCGNADRDVLTYIRGESDAWHDADWVAARLRRAHVAALAAFERTVELAIGGLGNVVFCHATPRSIDEIVTEATPERKLREIYGGVAADAVVGGHTHMQLDRRVDRVRVINAGSVGMPYEGSVGARWALLGPDVSLRRTEFDVERAAERVRAADFPTADEFAANFVLRSHPRSEAIRLFEQMAADRGERDGA